MIPSLIAPLGRTLVAVAAISLVAAGSAAAKPEVGKAAPDFSVADTAGKTWTLGDFAGKNLILEWTNHDCPYVRKHYDSGNMQALQTEAAGAGYVWLSVISSAPGKQGHVSATEADALTKERGANPSAVLLDDEGTMGRAYGAQTTPHMYVIDGSGTLVYMGGIDDRATSDPADIDGATNYVRLTMADLEAGKPVSKSVTRPYGCSVKY
jgi:peroxiredoxin